MSSVKERIATLAKGYLEESIRIRRQFHAWPELAFEEFRTSATITSLLGAWGIPFKAGIAGTGIVAMIEGKNPASKMIALRADMDALPVSEANDVDYKSLNPGIMHACGHDVHMASLLGTIRILNEIKDELTGSVRFIFQPSEEKFPGGAAAMIREGVLKDPVPAGILGQHTLPTLEAGKVGMKPGKYMASTDEVYITVKGKGGHAATPELVVDPILIAAQILTALQQVVSRKAMSSVPTVLSFGRIIGDGRTNIIPDEVKMDGTLRTFDEEWRTRAHELIRNIAKSTATGLGGSCEVVIDKGYPFLVNDDALTGRVFENAGKYLGKENVVLLETRMTAEDFAWYSQVVPGCFYRLGIRNESKGIVSNLHTSTFDVDENSLETGMGLMAWLAFCELNS